MLEGLGGAQQSAHARQVRWCRAERAGLDEDVAQRGGLHRAGNHGKPAGVCGELAQQVVPCPAADDVQDVCLPDSSCASAMTRR